MSTTAAGLPAAADHAHDDGHAGSFLSTYVFSRDHKIIGIQFLFSTLLWLIVGGALALAVRWQLAWPWQEMPIVGNMLFSGEGGQISPEFYPMLVTMHATIMIFFVVIPILAGAFGNFLIPLMIGADDMAVPHAQHAQLLGHVASVHLYDRGLLPGRRCPRGWLDRLSPPFECAECLARLIERPDALVDWTHLRRCLVDDGVGQLHDHDHPDARTRHDDVPPAANDLGHVHHGHSASIRLAGAHRRWFHATVGPRRRYRFLRARGPDRQQRLGRCRGWSAAAVGSTCSGSTRTRPCTS